MSELAAWDLDGTIRPGSLLGDAIHHGAMIGLMDIEQFSDPSNPSYDEVLLFIEAIKHQPRTHFNELMARLSDQAREDSYQWALERIEHQAKEMHVVVLSHAPDFLVKSFTRGIGHIKRGRGSYFHTSGLAFSGHGRTLNKTLAASRYIRENSLAGFGFAAGDTEKDLPMLLRARQGLVVNPDEYLAEIAQQRNWEVVRTNE